MSLESWKEEFYPKPVRFFDMTWEEAMRHSIVKWRGLQNQFLSEHRLLYNEVLHVLRDFDGNKMIFDAGNCALCMKCNLRCEECPIVTTGANQGYSCDGHTGGRYSQYNESFNVYRKGKDEMLQLLEDTAVLYHKQKIEAEDKNEDIERT